MEAKDYISWFVSSLDILEEKRMVDTSAQLSIPVWANVKALDIIKAIEILWETSIIGEIILADKSTGSIVQIFIEEKNDEIHVGKCDITKLDKKIIWVKFSCFYLDWLIPFKVFFRLIWWGLPRDCLQYLAIHVGNLAYGFSELITAKDMFGNPISEEKNKQVLNVSYYSYHLTVKQLTQCWGII